MANRKIIDNGLGAVGSFPTLTLTDSGFTEAQAAWLSGAIQAMVSALNGLLSFGNGDHATRGGNFHSQWIQQFFPTKDVEMEIPHGLGKRPTDVWVGLPDRAARFYTTKRGSWNDQTIWLACDTDGVTVPFLVF